MRPANLFLAHLLPITISRLVLWLLFALICPLAQAQSGNYAEGLIVYLTPGDTLQSARGALYRKFTPAAPLSYVDVGGTVPMAIENGLILKRLDIRFMYTANLATPADKQRFEDLNTTLRGISQEHPKTAPVCDSVLKITQSYLDRYDAGEIRENNAWGSKSEYLARLQAEQKNMDEKKQRVVDSEKAKKELSANLFATYPPAVSKIMLAEFNPFYKSVSDHILRNGASFKGVGPIDSGLYGRSKLLPVPEGADEAGIYTSPSAEGPTVIWVMKDKKVVCYWLGLSIVTDRKSQHLINSSEFGQALNFANRVQPGLLDGLLAHVAASKIQQVLGKKPTLKSEYDENLSMDILVPAPETYADGSKCHHALIFIFGADS